MRYVLIALYALALAACQPQPPLSPSPQETSVLTIYQGGLIYTGNPDMPIAKSVSVNDQGVIVDVSDHELAQRPANGAAPVKIVNLNGAFTYPGFVDGHAHLLGIGLRELTPNFEGTASIGELVTHVENALQDMAPAEVLFGRGWIETGWPEGRMPRASDIDPVSADNPVILQRSDGHAMLVNSAALKAAGIGVRTPDPDGGKIERDANGTATGLLIDNAMTLVASLIEAPDEDQILLALETGAKLYASRGWTGMHNMSVDPAHAPLLEQLSKQGRLPLRLHNAFDNSADAFRIAAGHKYETGTIQNRAVKIYMDGALGSRGALLIKPYSDRPETRGLSLTSKSELAILMDRAARADVQLAMHAIGDLANRRILDAYEEGGHKGLERWRIEHAQIIDPADIPRLGQLGLIASMQPSHAIGDLHFAPDRLGQARLAGAYAWRSLMESGALIVGGSDAPVEVGSPLIEFYAATARKDLSGFSGPGWHPEQALSRGEALALFTTAPAYASFQEDVLGTIEPGKFADFTILDRDIMTIDDAEILKAKIIRTVVAGETVFTNQ